MTAIITSYFIISLIMAIGVILDESSDWSDDVTVFEKATYFFVLFVSWPAILTRESYTYHMSVRHKRNQDAYAKWKKSCGQEVKREN